MAVLVKNGNNDRYLCEKAGISVKKEGDFSEMLCYNNKDIHDGGIYLGK